MTMTKTATKTTDPYANALAEREAEAIEKVANIRTALDTERARLDTFHKLAETTQEALEGVEGALGKGDDSITTTDLLTARAEYDRATMLATGTEKKVKRLGDWLGKAHTRKDVAEIVRDALVARMLPGAAAYATFASGGGFAMDTAKSDTLPALVVTQVNGGIVDSGVGEGEVHVTWQRSKLHAPLDADRLRAALEASGFSIDPRFGLNDGLTVHSSDDTDMAVVRLRNVAEAVPAVTRLATDVEGLDYALAQILTTRVKWLSVEGAGASIVGTETSGDITQTTARVTLAGRNDTYADSDPHGPSFSGIVLEEVRDEMLDQVRPGLGRCVAVEVVAVPDSPALGPLLGNGYTVTAAQLTYAARTS